MLKKKKDQISQILKKLVNLRATLDFLDNDIELEEQTVKVIEMHDKAKEKMKSWAKNVDSFELNLNEKQTELMLLIEKRFEDFDSEKEKKTIGLKREKEAL